MYKLLQPNFDSRINANYCVFKKNQYLYKYLHYLIKECYEEDYDPYDYDDEYCWIDYYKYEWSFSEWYFRYRRRWHLNKKKEKQYRDKHFSDNYKHTPEKLIIGDQIFGSGYMLY